MDDSDIDEHRVITSGWSWAFGWNRYETRSLVMLPALAALILISSCTGASAS